MPLPPWHWHVDVWALVFVLGLGYLYAVHRIEPLIKPAHRTTTGQQVKFLSGLAFLWLVSDWPFHDVGEQSLFSAHMIEHMVLMFVTPPLLLAGLPRWLADRILGHPKVRPWLRRLARMVPAFFVFNASLIAIHWPEAVAAMIGNSLVHLLVHAWLFAVSLVMWLPVVSPTPSIPRASPPMQMLYLFLLSILPTVPASFLTFSHHPIYPAYGSAAEAFGISAVADQTIAGLIMKLGGGFLLWGRIAMIWFRWASDESRWDQIERELSTLG
jgi:putative membrane protein